MNAPGIPTPSDAAYWQSIYEEGAPRWDIGREAPAWKELLALHELGQGSLILLGAGRGNDAVWFAQQGFEVTTVDFAPSAVAATRENAARLGVTLTAQQADLFALEADRDGTFDVLVEHTCFCAIEVHRRSEYARVAADLVKPGGHLVGIFFWQTPPDGPPFQTSPAELRSLLEPAFSVLRLEDNPVSVDQRAGREGWAVLRRRTDP